MIEASAAKLAEALKDHPDVVTIGVSADKIVVYTKRYIYTPSIPLNVDGFCVEIRPSGTPRPA